MTPRTPLFRIVVAGALLLTALCVVTPRPAAAQATLSAEVGLQGNYRGEAWVPVRVTLTNQGAPARVEARARFFNMGRGPEEHRISERDLPSGANERHTLYMRSPRSYGPQPVTVELYRDGRVINTVKPQTRIVPEEAWFIYGIGPAENTNPLNLVTTAKLAPRNRVGGTPPGVPQGQKTPPTVAVSLPSEAPDRWQGLDAADVVVLTGVSERDFRPEQLTALRDYAAAGGTVVVTGGLNWNRLTTAFFQDLLPVQVTGSTAISSLPGSTHGTPPGTFPICTARQRPDTEVLLGTPGQPLIVSGRRGSGRVIFMAFDPSLAPFRDWAGTREVWSGLLQAPGESSLIAAVTDVGNRYEYYGMAPPGYYGGTGEDVLADAPFSIPQLDIPAFYVVALFLLAYVIVLVPVNYFFLKARDKKEYAWITTPAIVLLFSVGAYLIGYGFKGGSTLAVKVGLVEARDGQNAAPFVFYTGLFSPRKTGYAVQFAAANTREDAFSNALFSEPENSRTQAGLRFGADDPPRVEDFAVDMWAMRVLKAEGVADLGAGVRRVAGGIRNGTPYHLDDCVLVAGTQIVPLGSVRPGATLKANLPADRQPAGNARLPAALSDQYPGDDQKSRMRRAVIEAVSAGNNNAGPPGTGLSSLRLVGWIREPVGRLQVDGKGPREVAETLLVVKLSWIKVDGGA